jgi:predicted secreted protein
MNAKDRTPIRLALVLTAAIVPLAVALALVGCGPKAGNEATDSLNVSTETPPATTDGVPARYAEDMNGKDVTVAPGAEFEIALANDPANAMAWAWIDSTNSTITLVERTDLARGENAAGSDATGSASGTGGAVTVWRFRAPTSGTAPIRLELRGPADAAAAQTYVVTVHTE